MNNKQSKVHNTRNNKKTKLNKNKQDSDSETEDWETDTSDSEYVPSKKSKRSNHKKKVETSSSSSSDEDDEDDEDDDEEDDEDDEDDEDEDEDNAMDNVAFQKLITTMFPSKYSTRRLETAKELAEEKRISKKTKETKSTKTKPPRKSSKTSSKREVEDEEEEEESDEEDEDEDDTEDADDKPGHFNIVFTYDDYPEEDLGALEEDENEVCNSDDEATFMKETFEKVDKVVTSDTDPSERKKKSEKKSKKTKKVEDEPVSGDVEAEYIELLDLKKHLTEKLKLKPKSKMLRKAMEDCRNSISELVKKSRRKNAKKYYDLINGKTKQTGELEYFKTKLSNKEQCRIMNEMKDINAMINIDKPYRLTLLESSIPPKYKATVMQKLNVLRSMEPGDPEYYKIKHWVDMFMRVPFGQYKNMDVKMSDGVDVCSRFIVDAKMTLDNCVYGLDDAKLQILQMVGQWIANPKAMGTSIAINGPPGTGKTTLIKDGISKILGREFAFIALGGAGDSSYLEGHSYTYEGSSWGKIIQILVDSKCMNPVIYFDELDKVSGTPRGDEIIGILTHLTDTTQNGQFHDKFFSEIDFDLSKCLFIFSYNDETKVNPILLDRMYRIQTKGYNTKEKVVIARKYLLPKIREQVNFAEDEIIIPDETLQYIISNKTLTKDESGVRNLKRCLEIVHTKLNLFRLLQCDSDILKKDIELVVQFPMTVSNKDVDVLIKNEEKQNQSLLSMYI